MNSDFTYSYAYYGIYSYAYYYYIGSDWAQNYNKGMYSYAVTRWYD